MGELGGCWLPPYFTRYPPPPPPFAAQHPALRQLQSLSLAGNQLTELPAALLATLPSLQVIDLRSNYLDPLPPSLLATLRRLRSVLSPWLACPRHGEPLKVAGAVLCGIR